MMWNKSPFSFITTKDGSQSLYHLDYLESYHSHFGAINESDHIYIQQGLEFYFQTNSPTDITVFEMGFGTGLNALLTLLWANTRCIRVHYISVDLHPLEKTVFEQLNYGKALGDDYEQLFQQLHSCCWEKKQVISPFFTLIKHQVDYQAFQHPNSPYDVVYFDAFSPNHHPELWTEALFLRLFKAMRPKGIVVTYCTKGIIKRRVRDCGFDLRKCKGPPGGKREMVRLTV